MNETFLSVMLGVFGGLILFVVVMWVGIVVYLRWQKRNTTRSNVSASNKRPSFGKGKKSSVSTPIPLVNTAPEQNPRPSEDQQVTGTVPIATSKVHAELKRRTGEAARAGSEESDKPRTKSLNNQQRPGTTL